ncbi:MAG: O-acetylhomoserine aminocarboxypropyltransferase/cysteine synthase family protein [Spirochaetia bacterium]
MSSKQRFETLALHAGRDPESTGPSHGIPVHRTTAYPFDSTDKAADLFGLREIGYIYTRLQNPTQDSLEKRIAALEGGAGALALASGTAAVFYSIINICRTGDEIISSRNLYGGTYTMFNNILPDYGITVRFVDPLNLDEIKAAFNENTKAVYLETIGNPVLTVPDFESAAAVAHKHHVPFIVDSTFTTPYLSQPIRHGADIVVHSLTKWIGGHGTGIGGVVVDSGKFDWTDKKFTLMNEPDQSYHGIRFSSDLGGLNPLGFLIRMRVVPLRNLGACISPDNAWIFLQGLETLALRMERHSSNALETARFLAEHPDVAWVRYPGLPDDPSHPMASRYFRHGYGGMVIFALKSGRKGGEEFINKLNLFSHVANVGDAKSLAIHPGSTTHSQLSTEEQKRSGIDPGMIRLSVGIEHIDDILGDIKQAI